MANDHDHSVSSENKKGLLISIILNSVIVIAEFIGGIMSGSLALLSDAFHNLSDVIALIFSYVGELLSKKKSDKKHTFAFKRAEVLIAFVNSLALIFIGFYIIYEAITRFFSATIEINSTLMLIVGAIGLAGNFISILFLHQEKDDNLNKKSAYLHLLYDTISSVLVVIGGIIIFYTDWFIIDLIASIVISLFVIKSGFDVFKDSTHILMGGVPENMDIEEIMSAIKQSDGVEEIHEFYIWNIDSNEIFLSAHIVVKNTLRKEDIIVEINKTLVEKFDIHHTALQVVETKCC